MKVNTTKSDYIKHSTFARMQHKLTKSNQIKISIPLASFSSFANANVTHSKTLISTICFSSVSTHEIFAHVLHLDGLPYILLLISTTSKSMNQLHMIWIIVNLQSPTAQRHNKLAHPHIPHSFHNLRVYSAYHDFMALLY